MAAVASGSLSFTVSGTEESGFADVAVPDSAADAARLRLGSRGLVEAEIDSILAQARGYWQLEPDEVMRQVAGQSARLTELWIHLHRVEGRDRTFKQVRTMQVGPLLEEMDRQFRLASRQLEVRRQDLDTARGF
jgi:hypothetical protein